MVFPCGFFKNTLSQEGVASEEEKTRRAQHPPSFCVAGFCHCGPVGRSTTCPSRRGRRATQCPAPTCPRKTEDKSQVARFKAHTVRELLPAGSPMVQGLGGKVRYISPNALTHPPKGSSEDAYVRRTSWSEKVRLCLLGPFDRVQSQLIRMHQFVFTGH